MSNALDRRTLPDCPTRPFALGDVIEVRYQNEVVALVVVDGRIRHHSIEVHEGTDKGKITFVGHNDVRLYLENNSRNSQTVLRGVTLRKIQ